MTDLAVVQVGPDAVATFTLPIRPDESEVDYATLGIELWRRPADTRRSGATAPAVEVPGRPGESLPPPSNFTDSEGARLAASLAREQLFDLLAKPRTSIADRIPGDQLGTTLEYALVLKTDVRKRGTLSNVATLVPVAPPPVPRNLQASLEEGAVVLTWEMPDVPTPPATPQEPGPEEPASEEEADAAPEKAKPPSANVYRAAGESPFGPEPINTKPVTGERYVDRQAELGVSHRYVVRSVVEHDRTLVESESSAEVTVLYRDVFPPKVPEALRLIPEGARGVTLIWNPNTEPDLGGYVVYRRDQGRQEWTRIDSGEGRTATFTDTTAVAGRAYEYAVSARDRASPPNESERSEPQAIEVPGASP